jgi:predicted TIM-barrel fold metal-dependent hydrolase
MRLIFQLLSTLAGSNTEARLTARECNQYGAKLIQDFPGRFGMFAAIPLPDTEGSFREIEYARCSQARRHWAIDKLQPWQLLGDPAFEPVFQEINRRKDVVFVHPAMTCCGNLIPNLNLPALEFPSDTTRTITSLIYAGVFVRYPDIRFIFSHGGGSILMLLSRIAGRGLKAEERARILPNALIRRLKDTITMSPVLP